MRPFERIHFYPGIPDDIDYARTGVQAGGRRTFPLILQPPGRIVLP
jgi:hypothetical protein